MNEFLTSLRADLTDRRLLPAVALVAVLLVAAIAYAALGGSGGSASPSASASAGAGSPVPTSGIAVSGTAPEQAVAETTDGFKEQKGGKARNPFSLLAGVSTSSTTSGSSGSSGSSSSSSSSPSSSSGSEGSSNGGGSGSTGGSEAGKPEAGGSEKKKSSKPKTVYDVAIEFGVLPPGVTPETAQLTPYAKLKLQTPLPNAKAPLIVFRGVTAKAKSATFSLVGEAILTGTGACLPSTAQCEAVDVKPGETEQLNYLAPNGETTVYELRVLSITAEKATAKTSRVGWEESKAGSEVLHLHGLVTLPYLHYSTQPGVLVFGGGKAHASRAHASHR